MVFSAALNGRGRSSIKLVGCEGIHPEGDLLRDSEIITRLASLLPHLLLSLSTPLSFFTPAFVS